MYALRNKPQEQMTADASKYPQGKFKEKGCKNCGKSFQPKAPSHMYCSTACADDGVVDAYLKRTYGITLSDYKDLLEAQDHKCSICGGEGFLMSDKHKVKLVVDHCHSTGAVRGLLCHNCNRALGLLQDSRLFLQNAIYYLEGATTIETTPKGGRK